MELLKISFKKLNDRAETPKRANITDAGFDLTAISINETKEFIEYGTGIAFDIPEGYVGLIYPRSSITKKELMLKNSVGVIDSGYQGEIMFRFNKMVEVDNFHKRDDGKLGVNLTITKNYYQLGERIGQIIFQKLPDVELVENGKFADTVRGTGGFGSTGK